MRIGSHPVNRNCCNKNTLNVSAGGSNPDAVDFFLANFLFKTKIHVRISAFLLQAILLYVEARGYLYLGVNGTAIIRGSICLPRARVSACISWTHHRGAINHVRWKVDWPTYRPCRIHTGHTGG